MSNIRIGTGYDVHRLIHGRTLTVGGVTIPHAFGLLGHSDADVLLHAICDALLGAAALGDIGRHFSDKDPQWKGQDSRVFLRHVRTLLQGKGFSVGNIDATIIAEAPRFAPYIDEMRAIIAEDLEIVLDDVNVKATTEEKMGFTGQYEGIAANAVALIVKR